MWKRIKHWLGKILRGPNEWIKQLRLLLYIDLILQAAGEILKYSHLEGINHIIDRRNHILERILWFIIVVLCGTGIVYTCIYQWNRYVANPTVISLERDYRHWNGTLPAITLCYAVKVDPEKANVFIKSTWNVSTEEEDYDYFMEFVGTVANLTLDNFHTLYDYEDDERLENIDFRELVEFIYPLYSHVIRTFDKNSAYDLQNVITERGMCHTINAPLTKLLLKRSVSNDSVQMTEALSCYFFKTLCYMKVNFFVSSATIEIHSPEEVPVYDSVVFSMYETEEITATYKVVETLASESLKSLSFRQRKCVFRSEIFDEDPKYSGKLCEMRCRALNAMELCLCKPFYYPFIEGPECTLTGYLCLHRHSWPVWTLRTCKCPNSCVHYKYLENNIRRRSWSIGELPFMQRSSFRWEVLPAKIRNRRDVLYSFQDFIVSFGGAATLFLGISFYQFAKMFYKTLDKIVQIFCGR